VNDAGGVAADAAPFGRWTLAVALHLVVVVNAVHGLGGETALWDLTAQQSHEKNGRKPDVPICEPLHVAESSTPQGWFTLIYFVQK